MPRPYPTPPCTLLVMTTVVVTWLHSKVEVTHGVCNSLVLVRHGARLDHIEGTDVFYNQTTSPWDSPLHPGWVRQAELCREFHSYVRTDILGTQSNSQLAISASPLNRTLATMQLIRKVSTGVVDSLTIDSCASESLPQMTKKMLAFGGPNPRPMRDSILDPDTVGRFTNENSASDCSVTYHGLTGSTTACCDARSRDQYECFAKCLRVSPYPSRRVVVSHWGSIRKICKALTNYWVCNLPLSYMDGFELETCDGGKQWNFVNVLRFPRQCTKLHRV